MAEVKPKRRFWQFHLSTLIVAIIAVSLFVCLNCVDYGSKGHDGGLGNVHYRCGYPFCFMEGYKYDGSDAIFGVGPALMNAVVGLAIFVGTIYVCEWLLRRREARKD